MLPSSKTHFFPVSFTPIITTLGFPMSLIYPLTELIRGQGCVHGVHKSMYSNTSVIIYQKLSQRLPSMSALKKPHPHHLAAAARSETNMVPADF